jgi:tellurite resistance protein TerC
MGNPVDLDFVVDPLISQKVYATYRKSRRIVITVVGVTVLIVGVCLIVLPGPAVIVIPIGLAILSLEYTWARRFLHRVKGRSCKEREDGSG